jgi:hypothetical protein
VHKKEDLTEEEILKLIKAMEMDCMTEEKNEDTYEDFYYRRILLPNKQQKSNKLKEELVLGTGYWFLVF